MTQITRLYVENPYQKCLIFGFRVHMMGSLVKALVSSLVSLLGRITIIIIFFIKGFTKLHKRNMNLYTPQK